MNTRFNSWLVRTALVAAVLVSASSAASPRWTPAPPLPAPRTEVAAASTGTEVVVVGGYNADGSTSGRVDVFTPHTSRWERAPDLPVPLNHAAAAGPYRGAVYVAGGYTVLRAPSRDAFVVTRDGAQRVSAPAPEPRAAAGAAIVRRRLYVVGGVAAHGLARRTLVLDLETHRWTTAPGPTPREHLAVTTDGRRIYAVGGRTRGYDTNVRTVESWAPGERRWRREPPLPEARGGTGAAVVTRSRTSWLVSVGGEAPSGTLRGVYGLNLRSRRWRRFADLPTPRHGVGVVTSPRRRDRLHVIAGGTKPGLTVSGAHELFTLP